MSFPALHSADDGAQLFAAALGPADRAALDAIAASCDARRPGHRLHGITALRPFLTATGPIGRIAATVLGPACRPVRALLFDKTADTNWSLGWHQDRTIAVRERIDTPGFSSWTVKHGVIHVEPPPELLAALVTVRVHLDPVPATNAPLLIVPGSHRLGRIPAPDIAAVVARCGTHACLADAGDLWLYATPILHASDAAAVPTRRRVLQVDFAADTLPGELRWLGV